jgi:hypothetical protein
MKILQQLKRKLSIRFEYLQRKRNQKKQVNSIIEKYKLNDPVERQKIIDQYLLIQKSKRAFGRKERLHIEDKISFMIHHKLIKVVE